MTLRTFIREMPKVELHVHLEGSVRPATLLKLAQRNSVELPIKRVSSPRSAGPTLDDLREFYRFVDFHHFIEVYFAISGCLKTVDDFRLIAYEFGADMACQNIRYAEVTFTPSTGVYYSGLPVYEILDGLNEGRARAQAEFGVDFQWILDIVRNTPEQRHQVAKWASGAMNKGVIALGLGGTEVGHPPEWFADAYATAREAGLHSVPHAGETAGPDSVWGAIRALRAERIGHGVRSVEDPALVEYLREHQTPLEVCPTSNLCLGVYPTYEAHPIRWMWEQGLYVTVNSDDPPMFNTNLVQEYEVLADRAHFAAEELEQLSLNALQASFLPEGRKVSMEQEFRTEFSRLREEHLGS
jgi:aminodeoxyfutalosine deaminase